MDENELIIYGFQLGNSDPDFQDFVRSLTNQEIHDLRMILYRNMLSPYQNGGVAAGLYGKDRYGFIVVPESKKLELWEESGNKLFSYIKDLWTALKTGLPGGNSINPAKSIMWKTTRARAVTTHKEGLEIVLSTAIETGLAYIGIKGLNLPKIRLLKDPGGKTLYYKALEKRGLSLNKKIHPTGFLIQENEINILRVQMHRHKFNLKKDGYRYYNPKCPHINIELGKNGYTPRWLDFSDGHLILDPELYYKIIRKNVK